MIENPSLFWPPKLMFKVSVKTKQKSVRVFVSLPEVNIECKTKKCVYVVCGRGKCGMSSLSLSTLFFKTVSH